jgi:hypothetical protein
MAKRVKFPGGSEAAGKDEIDDDDLLLEQYSDEEEVEESDGQKTVGSEDVSDFEGNPREAPRHAYFGADRCRVKFQLKYDAEKKIIRVCGASQECSRKLHKKSTDRAMVGVYDTVTTISCVDGLYSTYRSETEQKQKDAEHQILMGEAVGTLTDSKAYQERLKAMAVELDMAEDGMGEGGGFSSKKLESQIRDGWSCESDDDFEDKSVHEAPKQRALLPSYATTPRKGRVKREHGTAHYTSPRTELRSNTGSRRNNQALKLGGNQNLPSTPPDDSMAKLATEVRDALNNMTATMATLLQAQANGQTGRRSTVREIESLTDEEEEKAKTQKTRTPKSTASNSKVSSKQRQYYAVARGRVPGVYAEWGQAEGQVNSFSGALHKKFSTRAEAQRFVDKYRTSRTPEKSDAEESDGSRLDSEDDPSEEEVPQRRNEPRSRAKGRPKGTREAKQFPPLETSAPDPSAGNAKELFRMTMAGEEQMVEKLSPPGLDRRTMQELANATLDAIQLPGTSTNEDPMDGTGELVGALREMTEDRRYDWTEDRPQKDTLWRTSGRTSLLSIKTAEGLQERVSEFAGIPEEVHETQVHRFRSIFAKLHWSEEMIQAWSATNWFLRIGKDTLDHYLALHLHLFTLSNTEGWTYAQEALKHYGSKLVQFRRTNTSRLVCLLKIYIFLRDARKNDFYSAKLQEKRNHTIMAKISSLETGGGSSSMGSARAAACKKCGLEPHPGGTKKCWFRSLSDAEAKKRASQLMAKLGQMNNSEVSAFLGPGAATEE